MSISAFVPRFVNEQPVVLTGAASSSCLPHRDFVSMDLIYPRVIVLSIPMGKLNELAW